MGHHECMGGTYSCENERDQSKTGECLAGWVDGWMDGWLGGWLAGWMDGWVDGWMDGWLGRWTDRKISSFK